jgi:hypothetical protein
MNQPGTQSESVACEPLARSSIYESAPVRKAKKKR